MASKRVVVAGGSGFLGLSAMQHQEKTQTLLTKSLHCYRITNLQSGGS